MFDILTIAAIADELTAHVMDGRVQRVGMLSKQAIGLEIYAERRRRYVIASAENDGARLLLLDREPSFDTQLVTPLLLLLRKYVRGGIVVGIEQPPLDRVVRLSIAKRPDTHNAPGMAEHEGDGGDSDEDEPDGLAGAIFVHVAIEIMGRHSNIILVGDDGRIMEAAKRVTPAMSRIRPIGPKLPYVDAPAGDRLDPRRLSTAECTILLGAEPAGATIASVLPRRLRAVSPQMAREIAFRATGDTGAIVGSLGLDGAGAVARETRRLLEPLLTSAWAPHVYRDSDGEVIAFSAVPLDHLTTDLTPELVGSISMAAEFATERGVGAPPGKHDQRRGRLVTAIEGARDRAVTRRASLVAQAAKADEIEQLRRWGEAIYAYLWMIEAGQSTLAVDGESVPLDPALTAKENAQAYFERYRKAQSAGEHVPELIERAELEVAYLEQLITSARQAETFAEIEELAIEWETYQRSHGGVPAVRPRSSPSRRTKPVLERNGNAIYVGRSGPENDRIAFDIAGPNDTWLHARGAPGSHVVVRWARPADEEDAETIEAAAALAAYYSASRESGSVEVDITLRRHVRKIKGAGPGMVTYRNERTVRAKPMSERELAK